MLRDGGASNRFFLMRVSCEESIAIRILKDVGLIRSKMEFQTCRRDMTWSAVPLVLKVFVGGVEGGLLGSGAISLRLSRKGCGSS